jgi:hypothetical protein
VFRIVLLVMTLVVYIDGAGAEPGKDELSKSRGREDYTRYSDGYDHLFELKSYRDWAARQGANIPTSQLPASIECPQLRVSKSLPSCPQ